jgi:hypothetical protein
MGDISRRSVRLRGPLVLLAVLATILAACGGASQAVLSPVGDSVGSGGMPEEMPAASAAEAPGVAGGVRADGEADNGAPLPDDLKVVYTGSLQLVVDDLPAALARAKAAVAATGGYVGASQETNDGDASVATITYRIPATRWEDAIEALRGLATKVVNEQTQAAEVGGQLVDLEARIRNLRASEASLQQIAEGAGRISDLLEVEAQLTAVRGQIEQLEGQRARLEDQVAYGTLVATFGLEPVAVQVQAEGWDPAQDVDGAFATLIGAGQAIVSGLIWFTIVWLPVIAVIVVIAVAGRWAWRRFGPGLGRSGDAVPGWGGGPGAG